MQRRPFVARAARFFGRPRVPPRRVLDASSDSGGRKAAHAAPVVRRVVTSSRSAFLPRARLPQDRSLGRRVRPRPLDIRRLRAQVSRSHVQPLSWQIDLSCKPVVLPPESLPPATLNFCCASISTVACGCCCCSSLSSPVFGLEPVVAATTYFSKPVAPNYLSSYAFDTRFGRCRVTFEGPPRLAAPLSCACPHCTLFLAGSLSRCSQAGTSFAIGLYIFLCRIASPLVTPAHSKR